MTNNTEAMAGVAADGGLAGGQRTQQLAEAWPEGTERRRPGGSRRGRVGWAELTRDPQLLIQKARRAVGRVRAKVLFVGCRGGKGLCTTGHVRVRLHGTATLGARVTFLGGMIPSDVTVGKRALLAIGDETIFNYGVSIVAQSAIRIGRRCMFGSFVRLSDESLGRVAPVVLGDDVWVAHGAIIEPGVTIGDGSVVSAGSVVTADVPPRSLAIGNPARSMSLDLTVKG